MGRQTRVRKQRFFANNPFCCYCGGVTASTTEDHNPPGALFRLRRSPRGYVFPACHSCQNVSRQEEAVVSVIARFWLRDLDDKVALKEWEKQLRGVAARQPDLIRNMWPSAVQEQQFRRKHGIIDPDVSLLDIQPAAPSIELFGRKLACALHYKHTRKIIPNDGLIWVSWQTNVGVTEGAVPDSAKQHFLGVPDVKWNNVEVVEQFNYRFGLSPNGDLGGYLVRLTLSLMFVLLVATDPPDEIRGMSGWVNPFPALSNDSGVVAPTG